MSAPSRRARASRAAALLGAALSLLGFPAGTAGADSPGGAAALVEKEFQVAIKTVTPATVFIVPKGHPDEGSSGVLITKNGFVLSDGAAGQYRIANSAKPGFTAAVEVRVPNLKHGTYQVYTGKVVKTVEDIDSALVKVDTPPSSGFPFVTPRTADDLHVGSFTFTMGNSFGHAEGGVASLTAGIVSALVAAPGGTTEAKAGKYLEVISSAAVNPGVNGGPLVDAEGALVGIVSKWGELDDKNPFQLLGKAFPIDRIRAAYKGLPEASGAFPDSKPAPAKSKQSDLLETAISLAASAARPGIASLTISRKTPYAQILIGKVPTRDGGEREISLEHYAGPVSGVVVSDDGFVVTSLYNLGNVVGLAGGGGPGKLEKWISEITGVTAHFPGGPSVPARLVAQDQQMGIALYKAELPAGTKVTPVTPAPGDSIRVGRLVLCLGNPYGAAPAGDPLTTIGILSRVHGPDADAAWRGDFQTDAAVTDANCGGAMADIHGRLLGVATLWNPATTGRSSGIGFGVPWDRIAAALPSLKDGKSVTFKNGYLGVGLSELEGVVRIDMVKPKSAADVAGLKTGDVVLTADGRKVKIVQDTRDAIRNHDPGEKVKFLIRRDGKDIEVEATLDKNPDA